MDKRKQENLRVKTSITKALLKLMHEKSYSDITISELIRTAGVARVSFYRNYDSKEDVLLTLIDDVLEQYYGTLDGNEATFYTYQNVRRSFAYFRMYSEFVLDLYQFGYGSILLEKLNRFHEEVAGTMPNHSIERYHLYMYMGALFNTAIMWLKNGAKESEEDMAALFCERCGIPHCGCGAPEKTLTALAGDCEEKQKENNCGGALPPDSEKPVPRSIARVLERVKESFPEEPYLYKLFENCYTNTLNTTVREMEDGTCYIVTGDIPAMWLRDSAASLRPYLIPAREDEKIADILVGTVRRQFQYICIDPYANAFNEQPNGNCWEQDETQMNDWLWERKYEVDSLCFPIQLAWLVWKNTGRTDQFDGAFETGSWKILEVFRTEQYHEEKSGYRFIRRNTYYTDTLSRDGKGALVKSGIGMTWSGFRPSDDACTYGYLVPSNMFAVVVLGYLEEIAGQVLQDQRLAREAAGLRDEIYEGIENCAITVKEGYGEVYAYETDGFGQYVLMDDANVPSLLAMDYLGYQGRSRQVAENTRKMILSDVNPYFYKGKKAAGIGSPHTQAGYIWHIALCMQGLTAGTREEKKAMIDLAASTDGGKGLMHEGFLADDDRQFTRPWFAWANAMFCELVMDYCGCR